MYEHLYDSRRYGEHVFGEAGFLHGFGEDVTGEDLFLLGVGVGTELDFLEAVEEGLGDVVEGVGGTDEEDVGEVHGDVHVVVHERGVLGGVENL